MTVPTPDNPLYSIASVAKMFDVKAATVRNDWIKHNKIKAEKINGQWRISAEEVARFANREHG